MLYFAYGSNMSSARLRNPKRVPSAIVKATGHITGHVLKFHKISKDGSGKGNIEYTGNDNDIVHGVIYELDEADKPALDRAEGLSYGYEEKTVTVSSIEDEPVTTYYVAGLNKYTDDLLIPYDWYMAHVIKGARENNLPEDYIVALEQVETIADPEPESHDT